jgi:hypothetical protein
MVSPSAEDTPLGVSGSVNRAPFQWASCSAKKAQLHNGALPTTTPADGSALASGSAPGVYTEVLGTVSDGVGDNWTALGGTGDTLRVVDFSPGTGGAGTITFDVGSPYETYDFAGVSTGPGPLWSWAFYSLHQGQVSGTGVTLPLTASGASAGDGSTIVAQGVFEASADLGSAAGGPPLNFAATEHTAITVTAVDAS